MLLLALLLLLLPSIQDPLSPLTESERARYRERSGFNDRMRLFDNVVERYRKDFERYNRRKDFESLVDALEKYKELPALVDNDVRLLPENNKRKSRNLRRLEIQLRKARDDLENFKRNVPWDQQDVFNQCIQKTESVRATILQIIFGKDLLRKK